MKVVNHDLSPLKLSELFSQNMFDNDTINLSKSISATMRIQLRQEQHVIDVKYDDHAESVVNSFMTDYNIKPELYQQIENEFYRTQIDACHLFQSYLLQKISSFRRKLISTYILENKRILAEQHAETLFNSLKKIEVYSNSMIEKIQNDQVIISKLNDLLSLKEGECLQLTQSNKENELNMHNKIQSLNNLVKSLSEEIAASANAKIIKEIRLEKAKLTKQMELLQEENRKLAVDLQQEYNKLHVLNQLGVNPPANGSESANNDFATKLIQKSKKLSHENRQLKSNLLELEEIRKNLQQENSGLQMNLDIATNSLNFSMNELNTRMDLLNTDKSLNDSDVSKISVTIEALQNQIRENRKLNDLNIKLKWCLEQLRSALSEAVDYLPLLSSQYDITDVLNSWNNALSKANLDLNTDEFGKSNENKVTESKNTDLSLHDMVDIVEQSEELKSNDTINPTNQLLNVINDGRDSPNIDTSSNLTNNDQEQLDIQDLRTLGNAINSPTFTMNDMEPLPLSNRDLSNTTVIFDLLSPVVEDRLFSQIFLKYIATDPANPCHNLSLTAQLNHIDNQSMNLTRFVRFAREFDIISSLSSQQSLSTLTTSSYGRLASPYSKSPAQILSNTSNNIKSRKHLVSGEIDIIFLNSTKVLISDEWSASTFNNQKLHTTRGYKRPYYVRSNSSYNGLLNTYPSNETIILTSVASSLSPVASAASTYSSMLQLQSDSKLLSPLTSNIRFESPNKLKTGSSVVSTAIGSPLKGSTTVGIIEKIPSISSATVLSATQFFLAVEQIAIKLYNKEIESRFGSVLECLPSQQKHDASKLAMELLLTHKIIPVASKYGEFVCFSLVHELSLVLMLFP